MNDIDVLRAVNRWIPRRWKQVIVTPSVIAVILLFPELGQRAALWAGEQYAQRLSRMVEDAGLLDFRTHDSAPDSAA